MKKFQKPEDEISLILNITEWEFTLETNNKLLAALFDMNGQNLTLQALFNRRSWVTGWSKIFKKLTECIFLIEESNQATFLEEKN